MMIKSNIDNEYIKILNSCINNTVNHIYTMNLIGDKLVDVPGIEKISDGIVYIEFSDFLLSFMNKPITCEDLDDYASLSLRMLTVDEFIMTTEKDDLVVQSVSGILSDIKIINDQFTNWWGEVIDVDIALKIVIDKRTYYVVLWDILPGEINFISTVDIIAESKDWLRDRITDYWKAKSPNFTSFHRQEISIGDRLTDSIV